MAAVRTPSGVLSRKQKMAQWSKKFPACEARLADSIKSSKEPPIKANPIEYDGFTKPILSLNHQRKIGVNNPYRFGLYSRR